jgi:ParB/RepB/Spo0J family partition protein
MPRSKPRSLAEFTLAEQAASAPAYVGYEYGLDAIPNGFLIPLERLLPWEEQPRKVFDEQEMGQLTRSIASGGVIQPLVVRRHPDQPGYYIVVAGHRRLLAARRVHGSEDPEERARVEMLPCVVREVSDSDAFAAALVENLVRTDLTRREVMEAVLRLEHDYGWSGREIARRTGRNAGDVHELLRIARHPILSALVADEVLSPTAAGVLERLPPDPQAEAIARVRSGRLRTTAEAERFVAAWQKRSAELDTHASASSGARDAESGRTAQQLPQDQVPDIRHLGSHQQVAGEAVVSSQLSASPQVPDIRHLASSQESRHGAPEPAQAQESRPVSPPSAAPGDDAGWGEHVVVVSEHTRRKPDGAGVPLRRSDEEVARVARDMVTLVRHASLTPGQWALLDDAWAQVCTAREAQDAAVGRHD